MPRILGPGVGTESHSIVVVATGVDDDLRFATASKPALARPLVAKAAVEAFTRAVLSRFCLHAAGDVDGQRLISEFVHDSEAHKALAVSAGENGKW